MENLKKAMIIRGGNVIGAVGDKNFSTCPLGTVLSFAGQTAPRGFLLCDGASYPTADYPDLYAVIGNTYGGDTENFNVPNLVDKFIQGSTTSGTEKEAGLPNITGSIGNSGSANDQFLSDSTSAGIKTKGALSITGYASKTSMANGSDNYNTPTGFGFDASKSNAIYGKSNTVQPPALTMVYIIKAKHTNEGTDSGVSDDVVEYVDRKINDSEIQTNSTWSSSKINEELEDVRGELDIIVEEANKNTSINDEVESLTTVWSSKKTSDELATKQENMSVRKVYARRNSSANKYILLATIDMSKITYIGQPLRIKGVIGNMASDITNIDLVINARNGFVKKILSGTVTHKNFLTNDANIIITKSDDEKTAYVYLYCISTYGYIDAEIYLGSVHYSVPSTFDLVETMQGTEYTNLLDTNYVVIENVINDTTSSTTSTYSSAKIDEKIANRQVKTFKNSGSTAKYYKICSAITAGYPYNIKATTGRIDSTVSVEYFSAIFRDSRYNYTSQVVLDGRFAYNQSVSTYKEYCPYFIVDANQDLYLYVPSYSQTTIEIDTRAITIDGTEGTPIEDYVYNSFDHRFDERINDSSTSTTSTWSSSKIASTMSTTRSLTLKSGYSGYITEVYDPTTKVVVYNVNISGIFKGLLNSVADGFRVPKGSTSSSDVMHQTIGMYGSNSAMTGDAQFTRLLVRNYGNPHLEVDVNAENTVVSGTITYVTA